MRGHILARLVRHALNRGNVLEGPLTDRIGDAGDPGCQRQVLPRADPQRRHEASDPTIAENNSQTQSRQHHRREDDAERGPD